MFQNPAGIRPAQGVMIAAALASNVILSALPARRLFAWYVEAPVLVADTRWVSWAIHSTGAIGREFFLLYFFVLFIAAASNSFAMIVFGAAFLSLADLYLAPFGDTITTSRLLRIVFLFTVALFYGEVLDQLIDNAVRFTNRGTITVSVRPLAAREPVELRVEDTGAGMEERDLPRMFQPFRRLEESGGELHGRPGVGLAVVQSVVEQLGGELTVRSSLGRSSSFIVRIPYHRTAAAQAQAREAVERRGDDHAARPWPTPQHAAP